MLDIRRFRHEPEALKRALARRGDPDLPGVVDEVGALDEARRAAIGEVNELKARRNEASKKIGELKRSGGDAAGADRVDARAGRPDRRAGRRGAGERGPRAGDPAVGAEPSLRRGARGWRGGQPDRGDVGGAARVRVRGQAALGARGGARDPRSAEGLEDQRLGLSRSPRGRRQAPARADRLVPGRAHDRARVPGAARPLPGHARDAHRHGAAARSSRTSRTRPSATTCGSSPPPRCR